MIDVMGTLFAIVYCISKRSIIGFRRLAYNMHIYPIANRALTWATRSAPEPEPRSAGPGLALTQGSHGPRLQGPGPAHVSALSATLIYANPMLICSNPALSSKSLRETVLIYVSRFPSMCARIIEGYRLS